ncbi:MAG: HAD-IA family hydrolase [Coxiellaceae bacterium]|nr:HAD-IA family hydrolase [Coxiellaceae bacterium]
MHTLSDYVVVFDLDDTLYKEADYVRSGRRYIQQLLKALYPEKGDASLSEMINLPIAADTWQYVCEKMDLPLTIKNSLLSIYRCHTPDIQLEQDINGFLASLHDTAKACVILTDGRAITQRLKLKALNIDFPVYISEEWASEKPEKKRFIAIEKRWPNSRYMYVGDNIQKDFVAPNDLGWVTVGLRDNGKNIHSQVGAGVTEDNNPDYWVNCIIDLENLVKCKVN